MQTPFDWRRYCRGNCGNIFKTGNAGLARVKQMIGAVSTVARVAANSGGVGIQLQPNKKKDD